MLPSSYSCSHCKCSALCRLRRKGVIDRVMSIFSLRPVRCLTCGSKSYKRLRDKDLLPSERSKTPDRPLARVAPAQPARPPDSIAAVPAHTVPMPTTSRNAA